MSRGMAGALGIAMIMMSGCAVNFSQRSPWDVQQLAELSDQIEQFKTLARLKAEEADQLRQAKTMLEQHLSSSDASVGYDERGLVTRMLDQILFDSGKAELRWSANAVLDKVAQALKSVPDQPVGVEGHTDNVPIKHSGWADNKALSLARANAVIDYLTQKGGVDAASLTAIGYGEERPIASNGSPSGRQKNRRVEIIIMPKASGGAYKAEAKHAKHRTHYSK